MAYALELDVPQLRVPQIRDISKQLEYRPKTVKKR
jgi:hypothetical protein